MSGGRAFYLLFVLAFGVVGIGLSAALEWQLLKAIFHW
jgi:hypothetical protein